MTFTLTPLTLEHLDAFVTLIADPSLVSEYESIQGREAVESAIADPYGRPSLCWIAWNGGVPIGFCFTFVLPSFDGGWSMVRLGVVEAHRRSGLASTLLERAAAGIQREAPECHELCVSAWIPSPSAEGFAGAQGFTHARYFWLMERPAADLPDPEWPPGVEVHSFDGSERSLEDWNAIYNASFAEHYHGVISSVAACRAIVERPGFHADGLLLAYRDDACIGFCRCELHSGRGEIGVLGVAPEVRGLGLGRALLRAGVAWLEHVGAPRLTLMVDGENDGALQLYRSEGFDVVATREIWTRPLA